MAVANATYCYNRARGAGPTPAPQDGNSGVYKMTTDLCIVLKLDGSILARADSSQVIRLEGNYYFPAETVSRERLETSDREYSCPQKGTCLWVDFQSDRGYINNTCWIYPEPKPEFEHIAACYGFFPECDIYRLTECDK